MNELDFRSVWVSAAVLVPVLAVGLFLLRENPDAKGWFTLISILAAIGLRHLLDGRKLHRVNRED